MNIRKIASKLGLTVICMCMLVGCGMNKEEKDDVSTPSINSEINNQNESKPSKNGQSNILDSANLQGSVLEFKSSGCLIKQATSNESGDTLTVEADGFENKKNAVSVSYNHDCKFQIATLNIASGDIKVTEGAKSDLKKQSEVYFYGEFVDTKQFNATKVIIVRWR